MLYDTFLGSVYTQQFVPSSSQLLYCPLTSTSSLSLYLWLCFFCLMFTILLYFFFFFYISHKSYHTVFIVLWLISLHNALKFHSCSCKWQDAVLFYGWVIFPCVHTPHLYQFICWWTLRLLPYLGYCKKHCCEHWGACIFSNECFFVFSDIYVQEDSAFFFFSIILSLLSEHAYQSFVLIFFLYLWRMAFYVLVSPTRLLRHKRASSLPV